MKARLGALLIMPIIALVFLAGLVVADRDATHDEARQGSAVNGLAERITDLDQALGQEAIASSLSLPGLSAPEGVDPVDPLDSVDSLQASRLAADRELANLIAYLENASIDTSISPPSAGLVQAVHDVQNALAFRSDVEAGVISPLQIADRYGELRSSLLAALAAEASAIGVQNSNRSIEGLLSLIQTRSAHLDERLILQLAIVYQVWAPGQHATLIQKISEGELWLQLASEAGAADDLADDKPSALQEARASAIASAAVPTVGITTWLASSDEWLSALDNAIARHIQRSTDSFATAESQAKTVRRSTIAALALILSLTIGAAVLISVRIVDHLRRFSQFADAVASGRIADDQWLDDRRRDEIGLLARSLKAMTRSLAATAELRIAVLESVVRGEESSDTLDLAARLLGTDDDGQPHYRFQTEPPEVEVVPPVSPPGTTPIWLVDPDTEQPRGLPVSTEAEVGLRLAIMAHQHSAREAELTEQATIDALTGLLNRRAVLSKLSDALASAEPVVVLYIDLDGFKPVNDEHGHAAGDRVLQVQGERLNRFSQHFRGAAGRIGGDEFLLVVPAATAEELLRMTRAILLPSLAKSIEIEIDSDSVTGGDASATDGPDREHIVQVTATACIGLAASWPGGDCKDVLGAADAALYSAKSKGHSCCVMANAQPERGSKSAARRRAGAGQ